MLDRNLRGEHILHLNRLRLEEQLRRHRRRRLHVLVKRVHTVELGRSLLATRTIVVVHQLHRASIVASTLVQVVLACQA